MVLEIFQWALERKDSPFIRLVIGQEMGLNQNYLVFLEGGDFLIIFYISRVRLSPAMAMERLLWARRHWKNIVEVSKRIWMLLYGLNNQPCYQFKNY